MNTLNYEKYSLNKKEKRKFYLLGGICGFLIAYCFYKNIVVSLIFMCLVPGQKSMYEKFLVNKRKEILQEQFVDALYAMSGSFAAGKQMADAICDAADSLTQVYGQEGLMVKEFWKMKKRIQRSKGVPEELLQDFAKRSGSDEVKNFADTYSICLKTGGDMEKVIQKTIDMIIEKINIGKEIRLVTSQKKLEIKILLVLPVVILLFLQLVSPEYMQIMYTTFEGRMVMSAGLGGLMMAYFVSRKITNMPV